MTTQGNGQPIRYQVQMSGQVIAAVKDMHLRAAQAGNGVRFVTAFRQIVSKLQEEPLIFGEPLYRLPALKLLVRQGVIAPLVVVYGVYEEKTLVFIRGLKVLS